MRLGKLALARTGIAALLLSAGPAAASSTASPVQLTLTSSNRPVTWQGSRFQNAATPSPEFCAALPCDTVYLTVALPRSFWAMHGAGAVQVGISWYDPSRPESESEYDDFDLYVYGPDGRLVAESTATASASSAGIASSAQVVDLPNATNGTYKVVVVPSNVQNNTYHGIAMVQSYAPTAALGQLEPPTLQPQHPTNFKIKLGTYSLTSTSTDAASCYLEETLQDASHPTRCLRFDAEIANIGIGRFALEFNMNNFATNPSVCPQQTPDGSVLQVVNIAGGGSQTFDAGSYCWHLNHAHIHYHAFAQYGLYGIAAGGGVGSLIEPAEKEDFCMIDVDDLWFGLVGNGARAHHFPACDAPNRTDNQGNVWMDQGIERGWADNYTWDLPGQYIDITNVPDGFYYVGITANPQNLLVQGFTNPATGRFTVSNSLQLSSFTEIQIDNGGTAVTCVNPSPCPSR